MRSSLVLKTVLSVILAWPMNAMAQQPVSSQALNPTGRLATRANLATANKTSAPAASAENSKSIVDYQLQRDALSGRMLQSSGQAASNTPLQLLNKRGERQAAKTDARGNFVFKNVPAGLYALHAAGAKSKVVRVWPTLNAPPSAKQQLLVIQDSQVVRGQCCNNPAASGCASCGECSDCCGGDCGLVMAPRVGIGNLLQVALDNPWFVAAGTAAAIAIPLATTDDDERDGDNTDAVANGEDAS